MKSSIPNILTCCNLICGCISVLLALNGFFLAALLFMAIGAVFDFSDGLVARALGVSSPIGKELDSLADNITFGFAPASFLFFELSILDYPAALGPWDNFIPFLAFILAAFSAVRLAKFNLDTRQALSFIGLPTPPNALFWASLITAYGQFFESVPGGFLILLATMALSCWLLISEIPMFSMKFKSWDIHYEDNIVKYSFVAFALLVFIVSLVVGNAVGSIAFIVLAYILVSIIKWIKSK